MKQEELKKISGMINELCSLYDFLKENGISYKSAECFLFPIVSSNYSMGETVVFKLGEKLFWRIDHTYEYAKSCKFKAKHGHIVVVFKNKSDLKEYVRLCNEYVNTSKPYESSYELLCKMEDFITDRIDKTYSVINKSARVLSWKEVFKVSL